MSSRPRNCHDMFANIYCGVALELLITLGILVQVKTALIMWRTPKNTLGHNPLATTLSMNAQAKMEVQSI
jgi:hypothetical protein